MTNVAVFSYVHERDALCLCLRAGEIIEMRCMLGCMGWWVLPVSCASCLMCNSVKKRTVELVGVIDAGLEAGAWSPDEQVLVLLTSSGRIVLMSADYEVWRDEGRQPRRADQGFGQPVGEYDVHQDGFGESAPVSVGWGKEETQFRGSAGRMQAGAIGFGVMSGGCLIFGRDRR
jgi:hypothetical protein